MRLKSFKLKAKSAGGLFLDKFKLVTFAEINLK
jgi:hypothetical protein